METKNKSNNFLPKINKPGRTLLVKPASNASITSNSFDQFGGIISKFETKNFNSYFITFDTIQNALNAFNVLNDDTQTYDVKFSYYRIFFKIEHNENNLSELINYNKFKHDLITFVSNNTDSSVLYFKLYKKDNKYMDCGDFTIDTLEGMNKLVSKESTIKKFTIESENIACAFYRYKKNKPVDNQYKPVSLTD
jgi:hypothetical protein